MKKFLAVLLCLAMCVFMVACGSSTSADTPDTEVESTQNVEETKQEEPETTDETTPETTEETAPETSDEQRFETIFTLTPDDAEKYYQAVINGEVQGGVIDAIKDMDEYSMKCMLDVFAIILGEDKFMDTLAGAGPEEIDMLMSEAQGTLSAYFSADDEEAVDEGGEEFVEEMGTTMTLYNEDLDRTLIVELTEGKAFMEPDWVMIKDQPANYFISTENNYNTFMLTYGSLNKSTDDLIKAFSDSYASQGIEMTVTEVETFMAGGIEWEIFALVYDQTSTGIDKETNEEVTLTSTVYSTICFARPDSETAVQLDMSDSPNPDVVEECKALIQSCISKITVQ